MILASPAWADCAAPATSDKLLADMTTEEDFLRNGDNDAAGKAVGTLQNDVECLNEVLPAMIYPRVYRAIAGGLYVQGDLQHAQDWFGAAVAAEPTFDYGTEDLPPSNPILSVYGEQKRLGSDDPAPADGNPAFKTGIDYYLDGRKLSAPVAVPHIPHVFQSKASDGFVSTWMIDGNSFPDTEFAGSGGNQASTSGDNGKPPKGGNDGQVAATDGSTATPKSQKHATQNTDGTVTIGRNRPPEKTPLMIGGGLVIAGAGGVFFLADQARNSFDDGKTVDEITKYEHKTNTLFVISCATMAVGLGTATWGVIVDDGTVLPAVNVRF